MPTILNFARYNIASAPDPAASPGTTPRIIAPIPAESADPLIKGLINLFRADPGQKRATKNYNQILAMVAQRRAEDMRDRVYFAHTDKEGLGPNHHAIKAGYPLAYGGSGGSANNIESIAAGYAGATECWNGWLNSPAHKSHVLGLIGFYAEQIDFGIGHAVGGKYGHYYVFISGRG